MRLTATIATFVGLLLTISAFQQESYLWLIGSVPLTILGIVLFFIKEDRGEPK